MIWLCLSLQYLYILKAQIIFMLSLILFQMLISIFTSFYIDFNWYFNWYLFDIKEYFMFHFQLVSKSTIGILKFFQVVPTFVFVNYYLISLVSNLFCWLKKFQNFVLKNSFKIFLICIAYMQGDLSISSIYRFMLSVFHIEELDLSSLCDTRVYQLHISTYTLYITLYVVRV